MHIECKKHGLCVVALCFFSLLWSPRAVVSGTGDKVVLPSPLVIPLVGPVGGRANVLYSPNSGLRIEVDTTGIGERGFRPVTVTLSSATPAFGDRQITFRISARSGYNRSESISVEKDFELLQGSTTTTAQVLVPQFVHWDWLSWELWVDGEKDEDLSPENSVFSHSSNAHSFSAMGLPDGIQRGPGRRMVKHLNSERIDEVYLQRYPSVWSEYSTADVVVAFPRELQILSTSYPEAMRELLRWVRVGGNLWVIEHSTDYENLSRIESQLGLESEGIPNARWQALPLEGAEIRGIDALLYLTTDEAESRSKHLTGENGISRSLKADSYDWFVTRPLAMGTISIIRQKVDLEMHARIDTSMLLERLHWPRRHGNDPGDSNLDFNNFLIPDVGLAPVFEFQFLITLFVFGIGPLNYWLLKRSDKIPMLLATVPAAALATTVVLFAYGFLSEGVGTRVRVRSFTYLDQPAREASSWSRLSYYAGVAPSEGLTLPEDTIVYPILPASTNHRTVRRYANQWREVQHGDAGDVLTKGWLPSRTPIQYLSLTARSTEKRLKMKRLENQLQIANHLDVDVVALAVRDDQGLYYLTEKLKEGEAVTLQPSTRSETMKAIREVFLEHELVFPAGGDLSNRRVANNNRLSQGLMETQLAAIGTLTSKQWARQTYIAVTAKGLVVELGLAGVDENHSFHVVKGVWQYD